MASTKILSITRPTSSTICTSQLLRQCLIPSSQHNYATSSSKRPPAPSSEQPIPHRPYEARKTLLHRTYVSLLRSTPLLVLFQHNNLKGGEWMAIRRELASALVNVDNTILQAYTSSNVSSLENGEGKDGNENNTSSSSPPPPPPKSLASLIKVKVIHGNVFQAALRVAEYLPPEIRVPGSSREAFDATISQKKTHEMMPLLVGPLGILEIPTVSPPHLLAALNVLFPEKKTFKKGTDPALISGLSKVLLLGARIDKKTVDGGMTRWVSGLGGVEQLRGELVAILHSVPQSLVGGLESPAKGLWYAVEGRRSMLEDESKPPVEETKADS